MTYTNMLKYISSDVGYIGQYFNDIKYDSSKKWKLRSTKDTYEDNIGNCHDQALLAHEIIEKIKRKNKNIGKIERLFVAEYSDNTKEWYESYGKTYTLIYFYTGETVNWFKCGLVGKGPSNTIEKFNSKNEMIDKILKPTRSNKYLHIEKFNNCKDIKPYNNISLGQYVMSHAPEEVREAYFKKNPIVKKK